MPSWRPAADHRALHLDPVPGRLRRLRPLQDPRARAGLLARADDRRHHHPDRGANGDPRGRSRSPRCWPDGRGHDGVRRRRQAGLRRRPAVQADPDRLHERARPDDHGGPAAQAVRLLGRRRRADRRDGRVLRGLADGETVPAALAVGLLGLVLIWCSSGWLPKVPAVLVAVVAGDLPPTPSTWPTTECPGRPAARGLPAVHPAERVLSATWRCWWPARSASRWCR